MNPWMNTNEASNKMHREEQNTAHKAAIGKLTEMVREAQKSTLAELKAENAALKEQERIVLVMSGKGSSPRPYSVPKETFDQRFERIFGITCKRCGKTGLQPDSVHTCSPQAKKDDKK